MKKIRKQHKKVKKQGLWAIINPVKGYMSAAMILSALGSAGSIAGYGFLAVVLSISTGGSVEILGLTLEFKQAFIILATIIILSFVINYHSTIISHLGAFKLEEILRTKIMTQWAKVPLGYVISTGTGALKKVLLDDVKNLHAFVADSTPLISRSATTPVASLIVLLIIDFRLALVALGVLIAGGSILIFVMRDDEVQREKYECSQSDINGAVVEFVQAMPVVRTFDDGKTPFKRYHQALLRYQTHLKAWTASSSTAGRISLTILSPLPTLIAVMIAGIIFVSNGSLTFAVLIAALTVSTGMADALMPLMWGSEFIKRSRAAAIRIHEIMAYPELKETSSGMLPSGFDVEFDRVCFRYNDADPYALRDVSFRVAQNTTTALVGPSGAGKSTVAKLIPRFWDVTEGCIKIGGVDIREMDTTTLMNTVSFVFQDTFLFNDSLANNIKIANDNASDEDMIKAAKAAQIHDFVMTLPDGYETPAGDRGTSLSGGQTQRITIARAILRDTPVIVLDEATAFADPESEEDIIKALSNLMKDKTVIVIAHRLPTIRNVEQIVVLDEGKMNESGNHEQLTQNQGIYAKLWDSYEQARNWDLRQPGENK